MTDLAALAKARDEAAARVVLTSGLSSPTPYRDAVANYEETCAAFHAALAANAAHIDDLNRLINDWRPRALKAEDRVTAQQELLAAKDAEIERLTKALEQSVKAMRWAQTVVRPQSDLWVDLDNVIRRAQPAAQATEAKP